MAIVFGTCYHLQHTEFCWTNWFSCDVCHSGNSIIHLARW
jgi:hypothetical protein